MIYLFTALIFYSFAIILGTAASRNVNPTLAAGITNILSAVIPLAAAAQFINKKNFSAHRFGLGMAVLSGVCIAIFAIALNKSFATTKVGIVAPIVFGGAIFVSTILSFFIFKERVTMTEGIGLLLLAAGLGFIIYARAIAK
jgi:uncharacterized membrane protein